MFRTNEFSALPKLFEILERNHGVSVPLREPLGVGSFNLVYPGVLRRNNDRPTAVKILRAPIRPDAPEYLAEKAVVDKWLGPLGTLPNVLTLYAGPFLEPDGNGQTRFVTCWERAEQFLSDVLLATHPQGMPREVLFPLLRDVALCADDFYRLGLQHRDIKPENVAVQLDRAKVADPATMRTVGPSLTHSQNEQGTHEYMPPEAFKQQGRGALSNTFDRYSFAVMLAYLRRGRHLFSDSPLGRDELLERKQQHRLHLDGLDPDECEFIRRLTHPDPAQRPNGSVRLLDLFQALGPRPTATFVPPPPPRIKPSEVQIVTYTVDIPAAQPVAVDIAPAPATNDPFAPAPLSREILDALGRVKGLEQAIRQLEDGSHPDVVRGREQVAAAKSQWTRLQQDLDAHPMKFSWWNSGQQKQLAAKIQADPHHSVADLCRLVPNADQDALLDYIFRLRNVELARRAHAAAEQALRNGVAQQGQSFRSELERERVALDRLQRADFQTVIQGLLARLRKPAAFPIPEFIRLKPHLFARHYPWNEQQLLEMADEVHRVGRPAVIRPTSFTNSIGMTFVRIPAGEFVQGSDEHDDAKPAKKRRLTRDYMLQTTEVTQEQYERVMKQNPSHFKGANLPVEQVSYEDAISFLKALSTLPEEKAAGRVYRLPTEAEWEYAARAGSTGKWCFRDDESRLDEYAWYHKNSGNTTHAVGQKKANAWGLHEMHGNVWEWCQDWYDAGFYGSAPVDDPFNGKPGSLRVYRGGSWSSTARRCRSAIRGWDSPSYRDNSLGFRAAL